MSRVTALTYGAVAVVLSSLMTSCVVVSLVMEVNGCVNTYVGGEESHGVAVLDKDINSSEDILEVNRVVRRLWISSVDRVIWRVGVQHQIDTSISQLLHTLIMVRRVIDSVDSHNIRSQLLELGNITLADLWVGQWVDEVGGAAWLVVNAADVETLVAFEEGVALDGDGLEGCAGAEVVLGLGGGCESGAGEGDGRSQCGEGLHVDD